MSDQIIRQLSNLQPQSGQSLPTSTLYGLHASRGSRLVRPELRRGDWGAVPRNGTANLLQNLSSRQRLTTFQSGNAAFMTSLNRALKGGDSYPILTAVLGTAVGAVSGGAGLLFTAATLGVDLSKRDTDVLARAGDEVWQVEEIGKVGSEAVHVSSYFLSDPFRAQSPLKGWLIHEDRTTLFL